MIKGLFSSLVVIEKQVELVMIKSSKSSNLNNRKDSFRDSKILKNRLIINIMIRDNNGLLMNNLSFHYYKKNNLLILRRITPIWSNSNNKKKSQYKNKSIIYN